MKNTKWLYKKPLRFLCNLLIMAAPLLVAETTSAYFWGEPDVPEELKNDYKAN